MTLVAEKTFLSEAERFGSSSLTLFDWRTFAMVDMCTIKSSMRRVALDCRDLALAVSLALWAAEAPNLWGEKVCT